MAQNTPPPIPTQSPVLTDGGLVSRVWLAWFTYLKGIFGFNQTIYANGAAQPQELGLNFDDSFTVTDDPVNGFTTIGLAPAAYSVQKGQIAVQATGNDYASANVVFPEPYSDVPQVFTNPINGPRGANAPMSCYATNVTETGFTVNLACSVPTGGGGATIDQAIPVDWLALG